MADKDKCPPHDWVTTSVTTDRHGVVIAAAQQCNKCGDTRNIRA